MNATKIQSLEFEMKEWTKIKAHQRIKTDHYDLDGIIEHHELRANIK